MNAPVAMKLLLEDGMEMSGRAFGAAGVSGWRGGFQYRDDRLRRGAVREVLNGIFYVLWTGCQWQALPT
jgi:transposase